MATSYRSLPTTLEASLKLTGTVRGTSVNRTKKYTIKDVNEFATFETQVLNADAPAAIWTNSITAAARATGSTIGADWIMVTNTGVNALEVFEEYPLYANSGESEGADHYVTRIIPPGGFLVIPTQRSVIYDSKTSAAAVATLTGVTDPGQITDGNGYVRTTDLFGQTDTGGVAPGSLTAVFYKEAYKELGITNATNKGVAQLQTSSSGLAANTAYAFKLSINGVAATDVAFTTHTTDVTWGNGAIGGQGVLSKINTALRDAYNAGTQAFQAKATLEGGDVRFSSGSRLSSGACDLATPASGTTIFGVGNIPAIGDTDTPVTAANATDFTIYGLDPADALIDNGDGTGTRANGGTFKFIELDGVGKYKEGGVLEFFNCPPHASFKLWTSYNSAHSGLADADDTGDNCLKGIYARSLSKIVPGHVQVTVAV
tara:strand:+ start:1002 stop:2291 length:1290 start_codon:yes stop_codon:yes gene_type:complete